MNVIDFLLGIDIGSTTAKVVVCDPNGLLKFSAYSRHNAEKCGTLASILELAIEEIGGFSNVKPEEPLNIRIFAITHCVIMDY
jgi:activator of 2-hydroxyglutaryl-CoA dehydratase